MRRQEGEVLGAMKDAKGAVSRERNFRARGWKEAGSVKKGARRMARRDCKNAELHVYLVQKVCLEVTTFRACKRYRARIRSNAAPSRADAHGLPET